jgi:hypothetical protein
VRAARRNNRLNVRLENAAQRWLLRLIGLEAVDVTLTGAATDMTWAVENGDTVATFAMRGQGSAQVSATLA